MSDSSALSTGDGRSGGGGAKVAATATWFPLGDNYKMHPSWQPGQARMVDNRFEILDTLGTGYSGK